MKRFLLIAIVFIPFVTQSQVVIQKGHVRKITYSKNSVPTPVPDVRVKVETEERSDERGNFALKITPTGDKTFVFSDIYKMGYTLISPTINEMRVKKYALNPNAPVEIVLVDNRELREERLRIETNIRKENEAEIDRYRSQLEAKEVELAKYREDEQKYEQLRSERDSIEQVLRNFSQGYYESDKRISEEADKLARIDYQALDSIQQINIELRKAGKGKEMVEFNRLSEEEKYTAERLAVSLTKKYGALGQLEQDIAAEEALRDNYTQRYMNMAEGFKMQYLNDSALVYLKKRLDLNPVDVNYIMDYADFLEFSAKYEEAKNYYLSALKIKIDRNETESDQTATIYNNIGNIYSKQGNYPQALEYHYTALAIQKKVFGEEHFDIANSYMNIGSVCFALDDHLQAQEYYNKSLVIWRKSMESFVESVFEKSHPDIATSYYKMGSVYFLRGDYFEALEYYNKASDIQKEVFGEEHPSVANFYTGIGTVYLMQENYSKALEYYQKALAIQLKVSGEKHPDVATFFVNIGNVYTSLGDYSQTLEYYDRAIAIWEKVLVGEELIHAVGTLASIGGSLHILKGNYSQALEYYHKELSIRKKVLGEEHPDVATSYYDIGGVYKSQGDLLKALEYYQKALTIRLKVLGEEHQETRSIKEIIRIINLEQQNNQ